MLNNVERAIFCFKNYFGFLGLYSNLDKMLSHKKNKDHAENKKNMSRPYANGVRARKTNRARGSKTARDSQNINSI